MEQKTLNNSNRRSFLKKTAYIAPAIVALGALAAPVNGYAAGSKTIQTDSGQTITSTDENLNDYANGLFGGK